MYSTNIKDNRYLIRCLAVAGEIPANNFIVDTGAMFTCCNFGFLDENMQENEIANCESKVIGGLIKGEFVKFYRYRLKQFTIGNIDMGSQDIWITFNERVTDIVLGMDILKQIIMIINPYNQKLYFCKDRDDYNNNFEILTV